MNEKNYFEQQKKYYEDLISFLEEENENEENFPAFLEQIIDDKESMKEILHMITKISNNHHRGHKLLEKIRRILHSLKNEIKEKFTNIEIFQIFKKNKLLLLFLIKNGIISIDQNIKELIIEEDCYEKGYLYFFYKEIKNIDKDSIESIENEIKQINSENLNDYEEKRNRGENDSYICSLIRDDSVEGFISYITQNTISISSKIKPSIFETNSFLINKEPTLIEYATFFGAIQIFQYLQINNAKMTSTLWKYAIHGKNPVIIHIIENLEVDLPNNSYEELYKESIKCHHNEIANYFKDNHLYNQKCETMIYGLRYYNYCFFPQFPIEDEKVFYCICKYEYDNFVNFFMKKIENRYKYGIIQK